MVKVLVATPDPDDNEPIIFGSSKKVLADIQQAIIAECDSIKSMLLEKNRKYGNAALAPCRIFSKADTVEQLNVRIDDKLNRKKNQQHDEDEDIELDLIGYLILKRVARHGTL